MQNEDLMGLWDSGPYDYGSMESSWLTGELDRRPGRAGPAWQPSELVFTTRYGRSVEPRNFNRFWDRRCDAVGVRRITVRDPSGPVPPPGGSGRAPPGGDADPPARVVRHRYGEIYTVVSSAATRDALKRLLGSAPDR
ncbi:hypothetical protein [Micromonospora sp. WMMD980]|uniref:hypothetical protein n=1 Tax=Micromonospora sp. WMMD980 TaxID=3016088 RepID=UPI002415ABE5|nr:hypothetical protein [Micromonospora sp. WMMD980]MDG4800744.1 hypothetical protein [Micromonospora sp. WMMD980]